MLLSIFLYLKLIPSNLQYLLSLSPILQHQTILDFLGLSLLTGWYSLATMKHWGWWQQHYSQRTNIDGLISNIFISDRYINFQYSNFVYTKVYEQYSKNTHRVWAALWITYKHIKMNVPTYYIINAINKKICNVVHVLLSPSYSKVNSLIY